MQQRHSPISKRWTPLESQKLDPEVFQPMASPGFRQVISPREITNYQKDGNAYTLDSFGYTLNSEGLRCDELEPSDTDDLRIVFAGCSFTFGYALPVEHTFGHRLVMKLRSLGLKVPYWNLAFGGTSMDYSVRTLYQFLPRLKPDLVITLFPHELRRESFSFSHRTHKPEFFNYLHDMPDVPYDIDIVEDFYDVPNVAQRTTMNYAFFEMLMAAHECDYLWGNWSYWMPDPPEYAGWCIPESMASRELKFESQQLTTMPRARDLAHWGPTAHLVIYKTILARIGDLVTKANIRRADRL